MGFFSKIRRWLALRKAKEEEKKHIPSKRDILEERREFLKESKELKSMINKEK